MSVRPQPFPVGVSFLFLALQIASGACGGVMPAYDRASPPAADGGDSEPPMGSREQCNGKDDDLDGRIDEGCPIRITSDPKNDTQPSLSGSRVAWVRSTYPEQSPDEIWVRDLPNGIEHFVSKGTYPSLSGDRIAFVRDAQTIVRELSTGQETVIDEADDPTRWQPPKLDGDRVAWGRKTAMQRYDVVVFDLKTRERFVAVSNYTWSQFRPLLRGDTLVWNIFQHNVYQPSDRLADFDVYRADLSASTRPPATTQVTHHVGDIAYSDIAALDQNRIVITEARKQWVGEGLDVVDVGPCTPVIIDLQSGARTALAPESRECFNALALSGNRAILEYDAQGVSDLYLVKLQTGERVQLTNYPRKSTGAKLDGNLLVWQDDRNEAWDLYMMDLTDVDSGDLHPEGIDL